MNRNTPLHRYKPLEARTGLRASTGLARSPAGTLKPSGGLRARKEGHPLITAQRKAPGSTGFPSAVKLLIRTRAGNGDPERACCEACGVWLGLHGGQIQHIYARGKGGTRDPLYSTAANGALLCGTRYSGCHALCEDRVDRHMFEAGFWRKRNGKERPGDYPIMLHGQQSGLTVWLATDGTYACQAPERGAA